jgi:hypothetical protein
MRRNELRDERVRMGRLTRGSAPLRRRPRNLRNFDVQIPAAGGRLSAVLGDDDGSVSDDMRCCHAAANVARSRVLKGGYLHQPHHRLNTRSIVHSHSCVCKNRMG